MGIRIQPLHIDIPEDDPFKNDLLGRKDTVDVLTHLLGSIEGPCVLAVDAPWGTGKTTFLKMWSQHLRNNNFRVVEFNAWETDFSEDPFVAISAELTNRLHDDTDTSLSEKINVAKKAATKVALRAIPGVIRVATAGILDVAPLLEKEIGDAIASYAKDRLAQYQETRQSVEEFKTSLHDLAATVASSNEGRPLVLVIDELDRCRPSYAVELLEVAKHLFSVDYIVFVLAVNRVELAHSIKAIYGRDFDAGGYLRRFFDVDFLLPEPKRDEFIKATLNMTQVMSFFDGSTGLPRRNMDEAAMVQNVLLEFFASSDLSLRRIAQAMHRLGLVFASLSKTSPALGAAAAVAVILRTIDADLYHKFIRGEVSDSDVVDSVFSHPERAVLRQDSWSTVIFEGVIMAAAREIAIDLGRPRFNETYASPLQARYESLGDNVDEATRRHASGVLQWSQSGASRRGEPYGIGFLDSVHRLELLSTDLTQE